MRPKLDWRAAATGGALCLAYTCAAAVPAAAPAAETQGTPTATAAKLDVSKRKLNVRSGRRAVVRGTLQPGTTVALQIRRRSRWKTLDRDRAGVHGRYRLHDRVRRPQSVHARLKVVRGGAVGVRRIGRLNVYRYAYASWYGPGLYGGHLSCGGTLDAGDLGVAHKTLPCGSKVTLRHRGRVIRVRVIDRGPYVAGREYDLTEATARKLRFRGHGAILSTK